MPEAPSLNLHALPFDAGCASIDSDTLSCDTIVPNGDSSSLQAVYVVASHVGSLRGVQFGVSYGDSVDVLGWTACGNAIEIPQSGWPADSTGNAIVWPSAIVPGEPDSAVVVGYFLVDSGSSGRLRLTFDPRANAAEYVDGSDMTHGFAPLSLGIADVDGDMGFAPCGLVFQPDEQDRVVADGRLLGIDCGAAGSPPCDWIVVDSQTDDQSLVSVRARLADFQGVSVLATHHSWRHSHYLAFDGKEIGPLLYPLREAQDFENNDEDLHVVASDPADAFHGATYRESFGADTDMAIASVSALSHLRWEDTYDALQAGDVSSPADPDDRVGAILYRPSVASRVYMIGTTDSGATRRFVLVSYDPSGPEARLSLAYNTNLPTSDRVVSGLIHDSGDIVMLGSNGLVARVEACVSVADCGDPVWDRSLSEVGWSIGGSAIVQEPSGDLVAVIARNEIAGNDAELGVWRLASSSGADVGSPPYGLSGSLSDFGVGDVTIASDGRLFVAGKIDGKPGVACFEPDGSDYDHCWSTTIDTDLIGGTNLAIACDLDETGEQLFVAGQVIREGTEFYLNPFVMSVATDEIDGGDIVWLDEIDMAATPYSSGGAATSVDFEPEGSELHLYVGYEFLTPADPLVTRDVAVARFGSQVLDVSEPSSPTVAFPWRVQGGTSLTTENLGDSPFRVHGFDVAGRLLFEGVVDPGDALVETDLSTGVVFVRATTSWGTATQRVLIIR